MRRLLIALAFVPAVAPAQGTAPYRAPILDVHLPQNALMLMTMYRHVYVDIGTLTWTPIAGDLLEPFLQEAKRRRMLDRVMFGSDQMRWPEAIALAIDRVNRLGFLTLGEKQNTF